MLFADLKGFSSLDERDLGKFQFEVMKEIADAIDAIDVRGANKEDRIVLERNTWGDAIYLVIHGAPSAAECTMSMQEALSAYCDNDKLELQLPMSCHFGPVHEGRDYIRRKRPIYFGSHVARTARVEPITLPGEVFVTAAFAAQLCIEAPQTIIRASTWAAARSLKDTHAIFRFTFCAGDNCMGARDRSFEDFTRQHPKTPRKKEQTFLSAPGSRTRKCMDQTPTTVAICELRIENRNMGYRLALTITFSTSTKAAEPQDEPAEISHGHTETGKSARTLLRGSVPP
jgi:hypothetical protein